MSEAGSETTRWEVETHKVQIKTINFQPRSLWEICEALEDLEIWILQQNSVEFSFYIYEETIFELKQTCCKLLQLAHMNIK